MQFRFSDSFLRNVRYTYEYAGSTFPYVNFVFHVEDMSQQKQSISGIHIFHCNLSSYV